MSYFALFKQYIFWRIKHGRSRSDPDIYGIAVCSGLKKDVEKQSGNRQLSQSCSDSVICVNQCQVVYQ